MRFLLVPHLTLLVTLDIAQGKVALGAGLVEMTEKRGGIEMTGKKNGGARNDKKKNPQNLRLQFVQKFCTI